MEKKTIEEMRIAVMACCLENCKNGIQHTTEWGTLWIRDRMPMYSLVIPSALSMSGYVKDASGSIIKLLYLLIGLSERDAIAELREESDKYFTELKAERARNAALVAALEDMYLAYGTTVKIGQLNGLRTVQTNIGRDIKHALAANEKGGANG